MKNIMYLFVIYIRYVEGVVMCMRACVCVSYIKLHTFGALSPSNNQLIQNQNLTFFSYYYFWLFYSFQRYVFVQLYFFQ